MNDQAEAQILDAILNAQALLHAEVESGSQVTPRVGQALTVLNVALHLARLTPLVLPCSCCPGGLHR